MKLIATVLRSWRLLYRLPLFLVMVLVTTPLTLACFLPGLRNIRIGNRRLFEKAMMNWSRLMCANFGVRRQISGQIQDGPVLVASNHISWLDIQVLHSLAPVGFVAKAEIKDYPVLGFLGTLGGTVYHRRGSHDSASGVKEVMSERLRQGGQIAVFPEGGILNGVGIKRFHARMFAAAIDTGSPVQPVMLKYLRNGQRYDEATFLPGEPLVVNILRLMAQAPCVVDVHISATIDSRGKQRRELAAACEREVRAAWDAPLR